MQSEKLMNGVIAASQGLEQQGVGVSGEWRPFTSDASCLAARMAARTSILLLIISLLSACITIEDKENPPSKIALSMNASRELNVNLYSEDSDSSKSTPLAFKVLQLKDDSLFQGVGYEALAANLENSLGSTYLSHDDYQIEPGNFKFVDFEEVHKKTKFIAVVGAYNNFEEVIWKAITKIKPTGGEYSILLQFTASEIEIKKGGKPKEPPMNTKKTDK